MTGLLTFLNTLFDLALVVLGFSAIIVIHEYGHFAAARWAGIRVQAFAVGFGPALLSWRKGMGLRRGSSEPDYNEGFRKGEIKLNGPISPTEYRLNALPFGGYVKMLGQDDADPTARSDEKDSYNNCVPWKRMIVISAGVVANVITAAILFVIVFKAGLLSEPATIGDVVSGRPAATAVALNATQNGIKDPGLKPGDQVLTINGVKPYHFNDVVTMIAMSSPGQDVEFKVQRQGVKEPLVFAIRPTLDPDIRMLSIGVGAMASTNLEGSESTAAAFKAEFAARGLSTIEPGMRLTEIAGRPAASPYDLFAAVDAGKGQPVNVAFEGQKNGSTETVRISLPVRPKLEYSQIRERDIGINHLAGLTPVLTVRSVTAGSNAEKAGLKPGDIFERIASAEWPSIIDGIEQIRLHKDKDLDMVVRRKTESGAWERLTLGPVRVGTDGRIGFGWKDSSGTDSVLAIWPEGRVNGDTPTGATLSIPRGSRILTVNGQPVQTLADVREQLQKQWAASRETTAALTVELPAAGGDVRPTEQVTWKLRADELEKISSLGWEAPLDSRDFKPQQFLLKADGVGDAIMLGLHETHRVMTNTYLTFARLFQGTVKVEHLKGPVGIAHVGVKIAERGPVWLMFFLALISVNLAVINFLPIPIADGGHMVFLLYEQFSGRPPSVRFQNATAIVGLAVLGTLFVVVTFHDVSNLLTDITRVLSR